MGVGENAASRITSLAEKMNASLSSNDLHQESVDLSPGLVIGLVLRPESAWPAELYPEDLPVDWQLEYYANEFKSLYLNSECASELLLEGLDELDDNFELLLELAANKQVHELALEKNLLKRCNKVVLAAGAEAAQWQAQLGGLQPVLVEQLEKQLQVQTVDEQPSARELRDSIENLMKVAESQRVYCYFDGKAAYATAQQAITIAGLMGVLA